MAFDIHSVLLVFSTSMDLDLFYYLHCEVQTRYVYFFICNSSCRDVSWISTSKTRRKRWTPSGFQWYRGQHQTVYGARKGVEEWFVEIKLFVHYTLYVMILVLTFFVCFVFSSGSSGSVIPLISNFFRIVSRPQWVLYQYHVDYQPPIESRRLRTALLFQHEVLGIARTFDGALLFLPHRLPDKVIWLFKHSMIVLVGQVAVLLSLLCSICFVSVSKCAAIYQPWFRGLCCTVRPAMERRFG